MKRAVVAHSDFMALGGAEFVSLNILKALEEMDYETTLVTKKEIDWKRVKRIFGMKAEVNVDVPLKLKLLPDFERFVKVQNGIAKRHLKKKYRDFDLLISTKNEADLGKPGIQYIHSPNRALVGENRESFLYSFYISFYLSFFNPSKEAVERNLTICNSKFTADWFRIYFDSNPIVLNPPVKEDLVPRTWSRKVDGFVSAGKIVGRKKQKFQIEVMDELVKHFNTHLHICGTWGPNEIYNRTIKEMASKRDYIKLEGFVPRTRLVKLLSTHKYFLHTMRSEHYGIAIAEAIKSGMIPFVHDSGGPRNFVDKRLRYNTKEELIKKILNVREKPIFIKPNFNSPEDFREKFKNTISKPSLF